MKTIYTLLTGLTILLTIYGCNEKTDQSETTQLTSHTDTPFIQEYHEGFIVDEND